MPSTTTRAEVASDPVLKPRRSAVASTPFPTSSNTTKSLRRARNSWRVAAPEAWICSRVKTLTWAGTREASSDASGILEAVTRTSST